MALSIASTQWADLRKHGEETFPYECCGVLVGRFDDNGAKVVDAVVRCENQRTDSPHNRYLITPDVFLRVDKEAREREQDIVGFYHSHPQHPARWSSTDLEEAHWTGCSYVITSVMDGEAAQTNSFELITEEESKQFQDEEVTILQTI